MTLIILDHLIVLLMSLSAMARSAGNGLSLELINRDSVASPLYPGNLTEVERIQRMVRFSEAYDNHLQYIRPHVVADKLMYLVKVGIGSNNPVALHLWVSLSHALTWTQCEPCSPRYPQQGPMFRPAASATFKPIRGDHPICRPPDYHPRGRETCEFILRNPDGTNAIRGMVARERFWFPSSHDHQTSQQDVLFGCAHETVFPPGHHNPKIGGVFGMNPSPESFPAQLAARTGESFVFSYCLLHGLDNRVTYLRFGADQIPSTRAREVKITQLILREGSQRYYLRLLDISVDGRRLNLPPDTFRLHESGNGGCMLDIAHWATVLIRPAYAAVRNAMVTYFSRYPGLVATHGEDMGGLDLCYFKRRYLRGFEFPDVQFHFPETALHVAGMKSFVVHPYGAEGQKFCLLMQPNEAGTVIGAAPQQNVRVIVDVSARQVKFIEASRCHSA